MTDPPTAPDELAALRDAAMNDPDVPENVRGFLRGGAKLDALRLDAFGEWTFNGSPVAHPRVRKLFSRSLSRTAAGTWVLSIPPYTYPVLVDGVGRFVHRLRGDRPEGELGSGEWVPLNLGTLETDGGAYLGVAVDGQPARLVGAAYRALSDGIDHDDQGWLVEWNGRRYRVATRESASAAGDATRGD